MPNDNPWDWMQPHDAARLGEVIFDPAEQTRWSRAIMLGGLPYMWRKKAKVVRELMYDRMRLRAGDRVFILGESIASCGFVDDIRTDFIMKIANSLKTLKKRDKNCRVVRRKGRVYVINKANPRFKARQG